jgi:hypothetical protein
MTNSIRLEVFVNIVDGVEDGGMEHSEVASGMNGGRLGAGSPNDQQQSPVPFNDRVYCLWVLG